LCWIPRTRWDPASSCGDALDALSHGNQQRVQLIAAWPDPMLSASLKSDSALQSERIQADPGFKGQNVQAQTAAADQRSQPGTAQWAGGNDRALTKVLWMSTLPRLARRSNNPMG